MKQRRRAGIILHPTSLDAPDGIGDLGPEAYRWVDFLHEAGCGLWQVLPLGPTGYGDSPYQCFSAFAGNPLLVSPALLMDEGLLKRSDLDDRPQFPAGRVEYGQVIPWKSTLLDRAYYSFKQEASPEQKSAFEEFQSQQSYWLDDFALFMAIKEGQDGHPWDQWPQPLRTRGTRALRAFRQKQALEIERHSFRQFLFFRQWQRLRQYAASKEVSIIGDIPIFVAYDSADSWSHPELFYFDKNGLPSVVAGVPPDYFSPTGQLWGNPLYRWDVHRENGYQWWLQRIRACLEMVDILRLDHFRGFAGYWEVPANMPTAEIGRWAEGPGIPFFEAIHQALGELPIIAEDLGEITPDVIEMRQHFSLPGMKILQFAFSGDPDEPFLPHNYPHNCVAYTGTHDNDTTLGWYATAPEQERDFCRRYLRTSGEDSAWDLIRGVWSSVAFMALAPLQDFLRLGTEARMNYPGKPSGNWVWRMNSQDLGQYLTSQIKEINYLYGRLEAQPSADPAQG